MLKLLDDVTVLDAGHVLAGPFSTYQLAMLGARVTRVENPAGNDFARRHGGGQALRDAGFGTSFLAQNANKHAATSIRTPLCFLPNMTLRTLAATFPHRKPVTRRLRPQTRKSPAKAGL